MVNNTRKKENQMKNIVENNNEHLSTIEKYQKNNQQIFTKRKQNVKISKTIRKNGVSRSFRFVWWHWRLVSSMPP